MSSGQLLIPIEYLEVPLPAACFLVWPPFWNKSAPLWGFTNTGEFLLSLVTWFDSWNNLLYSVVPYPFLKHSTVHHGCRANGICDKDKLWRSSVRTEIRLFACDDVKPHWLLLFWLFSTVCLQMLFQIARLRGYIYIHSHCILSEYSPLCIFSLQMTWG